MIQTIIHRLLTVVAVIAAMLLPAGASAAQRSPRTLSADSVFIALPVDVLEILNRSSRMDMLDYYHTDSIYQAPNLVDGRSYLELVTPDYLKVRLTDVSTIEIKILPLRKGGDIAAVSYTVDSTGAQADSELFFFDSAMQPLKTSDILRMPEIKHFFHIDKGCATTMKEIEHMVEFPTICYTFSPDNTDLTAALTVGQNMDRDDFNIIKVFMLPPLTYRWDGSRYKR